MNIHKIGSRERMLQNYGVTSDYAQEFPSKFPQCIGSQQSSNMGLCFQSAAREESSQQHNFWSSNSPSTIIGHIGSPASAFFAAERYMGLQHYDHRDKDSTCCSQQSKNYDMHVPSYEQNGNCFFADSSAQVEPSFQPKNALQPATEPQSSSNQYIVSEGLYRNPFSNLSERERILNLKNKLLGDFNDENERSPSMPFDGNQDVVVSSNLYGSHFTQLRQSGRPSGCVSAASNNSSSSGAVLSSKTRIRWTQELHDRFVECVNRLGGADKATPKAILKLMDWEGLTIFQVKSHLQKYRNAKCPPDSAEGKLEKKSSTNSGAQIDIKTGMQLKEALQLQLDVQRRLHEQLEIQRKLQLSIEEQGRQLKMMIDQQQKTTKSFLETQNSNVTSPSYLPTTPEDVEVLIPENSGYSHSHQK